METNAPETGREVEFLEPVMHLRHVVLLKFKDDTSHDQVRDIQNKLCALPSKIDVIYDFEWGTECSVEKLNEGFTHCLFFTFLTEADRAVYLPHPVHQEAVDFMKPHLEKVLVFDYWTRA